MAKPKPVISKITAASKLCCSVNMGVVGIALEIAHISTAKTKPTMGGGILVLRDIRFSLIKRMIFTCDLLNSSNFYSITERLQITCYVPLFDIKIVVFQLDLTAVYNYS